MTRITFYWLVVFIGGGILLLASGESTVSAIAEQTSPSSSEHSILSTTSTSSLDFIDNSTSSDHLPHTDSGPPLKSNSSKELSDHTEDAFPENTTSLEDTTEKAELQKAEEKTALSEMDSTTDDALSAEDQSSSDMYLSTSEANTAPVSGRYKPEVAEMESDVSTTEHLKDDAEKEPSSEERVLKSTTEENKQSTDPDMNETNSKAGEQTETLGPENTTSGSSVAIETKSSPSSKSATKKRSVNGTVTTVTPSDATFSTSFISPSPERGSGSHSDADMVEPDPGNPEMIPTEGHRELETTEFSPSSVLPIVNPNMTELETERSPDVDGKRTENILESTTGSDPDEREAAASEVVLFNTSGGVPRPMIVTPDKAVDVNTMPLGSTLIPENEIDFADDLGGHGVRFDPDGMINDGPQDPDSIVFSVSSNKTSSPLQYSTFAKISEHPELESSTFSEKETNEKEVESGMVLSEGSNENIPMTFGAELPSVSPIFDPASLSTVHLLESQTSSHLLDESQSSPESQASSHQPESQSSSLIPESQSPSHIPESEAASHQPEQLSSSPQSASHLAESQTSSHQPESQSSSPQLSSHLVESQPSSHQPESQSSSNLPESPTSIPVSQSPSHQLDQQNGSRPTNHGADQPPTLNNNNAESPLTMLQDSPSSPDQNQSSHDDDTKVDLTTPPSSSLMTIVHQPDQSVIRPVKIKLATTSPSSTSVSPPILPTEKKKTPELSSNLEGSNSTVVAGVAVKTSVSVSLPLSKTGNESGGALPSAFEELLKNSSIIVIPGNPPTIMLKPDNDSASSSDTPSTTPTEATTAGGIKIRKPKIKIPGVAGGGDRPTRKPYTPSLSRPTSTSGPPVAIFGKTRTRANSITSSTTARPFRPYSTIKVHYASHLPPGILPEIIVSTEPVTEPPPPTTTEEPISEVPFTDQTITPTVSSEDDVTLIKVAGSIALDRGIRWNELLNNRHSPEFKEKSKIMHLHLERLFRSSPVAPHLWKIQIDGFSGSKKTRPVLVDFFLYLIKSPEEVPLDLLTTVLHEKLSPNNTFSTYRVDTNRTFFERLSEERMVKTTPPPEMDELEPPIPQWAIAVIVIGAASLIFIVLFAAVTMYGRHHMRRRYSSKLNEEDLERSSGEWESKMAAAYENMAADTIYDAEDLQSDTYKKQHNRIATFHGIPSTLKRCDSWSSNGWTSPPKRKRPPHVH